MDGVETPAYTRRPPALPAPRDEPRSSLECPLTQELCPAHMHMTCTYAHAHAPVLLYEETLKPQSPSVLTPRFPDPDRPAHTCPANIYCSGAWKGVCLSCSCCSRGGENPTETCTYLVTAGEPARAWSPAWDTVAADPCNGFQPGRDVRPRPRCQNSRYLYGQTRALPKPYLLVRDFEYVLLRPERHRAQSCAIALRSPAPQRCFRADIHHDFRLKL